ncbi:hypothetical protein GCM10023185_16010 [Hymenobacter saemangeumensis]|uniref:Lipoprotein n=1 Tax=Hymenobacter saemangeumensis TaxID=1084522 RepID=A0ABP8IA32_9BACT
MTTQRLRGVWLGSVLVLVSACGNLSLLDTPARTLWVRPIPAKGYQVRVVYRPSNATVQAAIQVVQQPAKQPERVLGDYERYNCLDTCWLTNNSRLTLVLRDTVSQLGNHPDTIIVALP